MEAPRVTAVQPARVAARTGTLERLLERRRLQHGAYVERARAWEANRPASAGPVEFPRDEAQVIALGVPCVDCLALIYEQGQAEGLRVAEVAQELAVAAGLPVGEADAVAVVPAEHEVTIRVMPGRHWAEFVVARCHR
jgi:hypothetical protein